MCAINILRKGLEGNCECVNSSLRLNVKNSYRDAWPCWWRACTPVERDRMDPHGWRAEEITRMYSFVSHSSATMLWYTVAFICVRSIWPLPGYFTFLYFTTKGQTELVQTILSITQLRWRRLLECSRWLPHSSSQFWLGVRVIWPKSNTTVWSFYSYFLSFNFNFKSADIECKSTGKFHCLYLSALCGFPDCNTA